MLRNLLMVLVGVALLVGCSPKIDQKKYENLHRAAKAIQGAIAVGVNYQKFGELLQNLSTEISIANDRVKSEAEKELLKQYHDVLMTYQESFTVWETKIDTQYGDYVYSGQIYVNRKLKPIISKYSLATEQHTYPHNFETISENAIQIIWIKADESLEKATKLYLGQ